jgi:hypothetical protein
MRSAATHRRSRGRVVRRVAALTLTACVGADMGAELAFAQGPDPCAGVPAGALFARPTFPFAGQTVTFCLGPRPAGTPPIATYAWDVDGVAGYEQTTTVPYVQVVYAAPTHIRGSVGTTAGVSGFYVMAVIELRVLAHEPQAATASREGSRLLYRGSAGADHADIYPNDDPDMPPSPVPQINISPTRAAPAGIIEPGLGCALTGADFVTAGNIVQCPIAGITDIQWLAGDGADRGRAGVVAGTALVMRGGAGNDTFGAVGSGVAGAPAPRAVPIIDGGAGDDAISMSLGTGTLIGGAGDDQLGWDGQRRSDGVRSNGGSGNDRFGGDGRGPDRVQGGPGDDTIAVRDGRPGTDADDVTCGPGVDSVTADRGVDRVAPDCENVIHSNAEDHVFDLLAVVRSALGAHGLPAGGLALRSLGLPSGGRLRVTLTTPSGRTLAAASKRVKRSGVYTVRLKPTARGRRHRGRARLIVAFAPRGGRPVRYHGPVVVAR